MHSNHQPWTFTRRSQAAVLLFNDRDRMSSSFAKNKRKISHPFNRSPLTWRWAPKTPINLLYKYLSTHQVLRWIWRQKEAVLWNSKSKINLAAVESAKPQKSLTLARNVQRSGRIVHRFILFPIPAPFTVLLHCLPLCSVMFLCLQFSDCFFSTQSLSLSSSGHRILPNSTHTLPYSLLLFAFLQLSVGLSSFGSQTLWGDLALGRWF